jgi:ectoine hydroxylase-related dioxygenase (phytanoyl-CoA dioxygenase family)
VTSGEVAAALARDGWVVLEGALTSEQVGDARRALQPLLDGTPFGANSFVGHRTRRVFGLPAKTRALDALLVHPAVLDAFDAVLGAHLLSTTVAVEIHPGETAQTLHTDASAWPVPHGAGQIVANAIWALDDFTEENGATRLVRASHLVDAAPAPGGPVVVASMPAGSVLLYVGSLWHGGGPNRSDRARLGVIAGYVAAWLRQQETFTLTCPPAMARTMPERLQRLLGYGLYPPFVGHVDGRDPGELLS